MGVKNFRTGTMPMRSQHVYVPYLQLILFPCRIPSFVRLRQDSLKFLPRCHRCAPAARYFHLCRAALFDSRTMRYFLSQSLSCGSCTLFYFYHHAYRLIMHDACKARRTNSYIVRPIIFLLRSSYYPRLCMVIFQNYYHCIFPFLSRGNCDSTFS